MKSAAEKSLEWPAYGWFTALSCLGSISGAISFGARIGQLHGVYASRKIELFGTSTPSELQEMNRLRAAELHFCAVHFATVPFEAGFMIIAKLLVLQRMLKFSIINSLRERAWLLASRVFLAVFIVGIAIGILANITAAFYYSQAANLNTQASEAWAGNDSAAGNLLLQSAVSSMSQAGRIASVQRLSEIVMLLLTVSAFLVVGFYSLRIIAAALSALVSAEKKLCDAITESDRNIEKSRGQSIDHRKIVELQTQQHKNIELVIQAGNQGRKLKQKVSLTVLCIFVTVLLLTVFMVTYGVALSSQNFDDTCSPDHCNPCKNVYANMIFWMLYALPRHLALSIALFTTPYRLCFRRPLFRT